MASLRKIYWFLFIYDLNDVSDGHCHDEPWKRKLMKDLTVLVLLSYIMFIFNPLMPIVADILAHTFWEKEHLLSEHRVIGGNHIYKELSSAAKQSDKDKSSGSAKSDPDTYVHLGTKNVFAFSNSYPVTQASCLYLLNYPVPFPNKDYPPPRA